MNLAKLNLPGLAVLLFALCAPGLAGACDTWVALPDVTAGGCVMLGKNSDRPPFGCQPLVFNARAQWPAGSRVDLGRTSIPQAETTYATLGSSPYWCWGYEEGINEYGVAIGNEGVWTKPLTEAMEAHVRREGPELGPTGMDLLRLGLERGRTAREALEVITSLLEEHGQFGSGVPGADVPGSYENSYIIADPTEAYILETAGRRWAARKVAAGSASISNRLSIEAEWQMASADLIEYAIDQGWWDEARADEFNFREAYVADAPGLEDRDRTARVRQEVSCSMLLAAHGSITVASMKEIARDQSSDPAIDLDQTASSCVAVLPAAAEGIPVFWWCAARPSNGCFVPFFVDAGGVPDIVSAAGTFGKRVVAPSRATPDEFSRDSYWWLFRDLTDMVNADREVRQPQVRAELDALEAEFEAGLPAVLKEAGDLKRAGDHEGEARVLAAYTAACVEMAVNKVNELRGRYEGESVQVPDRFEPYVGTYLGNFGPFQDDEFRVKVQSGRLAVDVPGQMVYELLEPDEEGMWRFALTPLVSVSFEDDGSGAVTALTFHQASELTKDTTPDSTLEATEDAPEEYRPYIGRYIIPPGLAEMNILSGEGKLILRIPSQQETIELLPPDEKGWWYFAMDDAAAISFVEDEAGSVTKLQLHQRFVLPRKPE